MQVGFNYNFTTGVSLLSVTLSSLLVFLLYMILKLPCSLFLSYPHQQGCRVPEGRRLPVGHSQDTAALWPPAWGLHHSPPAASAEQLRERERERDREDGWVGTQAQTAKRGMGIESYRRCKNIMEKGAQGMNNE